MTPTLPQQRFTFMKSFNIVCLSLVLSACGGGGSSSGAGNNVAGNTGVEISTFSVFGDNEVYEHTGEGIYNLDISGFNHTITTTENQTINNLSMTGSNNILTVGAGSTIALLEISGNDNSVSVPEGSFAELELTGFGNQLITY